MQNDSHFVIKVFSMIKLSDVTSPSIVKSTIGIILAVGRFIKHYIKNKETKVYKLPKQQDGRNKGLRRTKGISFRNT